MSVTEVTIAFSLALSSNNFEECWALIQEEEEKEKQSQEKKEEDKDK